MTEHITLAVAFSAGLLSFLSPCVLPLAPVYLANLYGAQVFEPSAKKNRVPIFLHSLSFVVGFSLIFTTLGAIAGLTGFAITLNQALLNKVAGSLLIVFGLFTVAAWKVPWLNYEKRLTTSAGTTVSYLRSFLIGAVFSMAWTACVGPILGGIMALALNSATAWRGAYLLAVYSLGLGLPFLIVGAAFDSIAPLLRRIRHRSGLFYVISSALLVAVGVLILTNRLGWLSSLAG
jgi:cytochrome c-type biogenesis protein